jgi:Flp pilus assembly protein TadB
MTFYTSLFWFTITVIFGFIAIRTIQIELFERRLIQKRSDSSILIVLFLIFLPLSIQNDLPNWIFVIAYGSLLVLIPLTSFFIRLKRRKAIRKQFLLFLDRLILNLKSGKPFVAAFHEANRNTDLWLKNRFLLILDFIQQSNSSGHLLLHEDPWVKHLVFELAHIYNQKHKILQRIESVRDRLWEIEHIRQRSMRAAQQPKAQIYVLTALYFALLLVSAKNFGFFANRQLILASSTLFALGLIASKIVSKQKAWVT